MTEASVNSQDTANTGESERKRTLQMTGVSKTYQMGDSVVHALREVDFDLYTGD